MEDFFIERKIYYHDTGCGGVVYYANYLKHLEEGRTEFFSHRGISIKKLAERGTMFVVARLQISYKAPARYQDIIKIFTWVAEVRNSSLKFIQEIKRDSSTLIKAETTWVCIGQSFKPKLIPEKIKKIFL